MLTTFAPASDSVDLGHACLVALLGYLVFLALLTAGIVLVGICTWRNDRRAPRHAAIGTPPVLPDPVDEQWRTTIHNRPYVDLDSREARQFLADLEREVWG